MQFNNPFATYNQVDKPDFITFEQNNIENIPFKEYESDNKIDLINLINKIKTQDSDQFNSIDDDDLNLIDNNTQNNIQNNTQNNIQNNVYKKESNSKKQLSQIMDDLGISGSKKQTLLKIAKIESNYNSKSQSNGSSACGLFGFINSTRRKFSNLSRMDFLNNVSEQVRCASQLYDYNKQFLINKGFNPSEEAIALTWLSPKWAITYLKTGKNSGSDAFGTTSSKYLKLFKNA